MTQSNAIPAKSAVKMNRQQRRQAARTAKKAQRPGSVAAVAATTSLCSDPAREVATAAQFHQAGDLQTAANIYHQITERHPTHFDSWHGLGMIAYQTGQFETAVELISRAIRIKPNDTIAYTNLGSALEKSGRPDEAIMVLNRAISLDKKNAHALVCLGNVLKDQLKIQQSISCFRRAIAIDPNLVSAHNNLGNLMRHIGRLEDATACIRKVVAIDPKYAAGHNNLGVVLQEQGQIDAAIKCFRQALTLDPGYAEAHNNLGSALQTGGQFDEAVAEFTKALTITPEYGLPYKNLISAKKVKAGDPVIKRIEGLLQSETLAATDRIEMNFTLGKCFDDIGEFDDAFRYYRTANELNKAIRPFDTRVLIDENDRIISTYTRAFFEEKTSFGSDSERPVFIVGMPRSGTTLVEQILASHVDVFGAGELPYFNYVVQHVAGLFGGPASYPECAATVDHSLARRLSQEYLRLLQSRSSDALRVTDKLPSNFRHLGMIALLFPRARIIHCRRDPLDVCLSCYIQSFQSQPFSHDLADIGTFYLEYERIMDNWKGILPLPILDVSYEELIADMERVSRRMIEFCGLEWDDACLAFHKTDRPVHTASRWQVRQPVYKTSVERWKRYEKHLGPLREALADSE